MESREHRANSLVRTPPSEAISLDRYMPIVKRGKGTSPPNIRSGIIMTSLLSVEAARPLSDPALNSDREARFLKRGGVSYVENQR